MGYTIQIRHKESLTIPEDSNYVPPNPQWPNYIKLSGMDMSVLLRIMGAARIVDLSIDSAKKKKECRPGAVPAYKFASNDGYVVTASDARTISDMLLVEDVCTPPFLQPLFPKLDTSDPELMAYVRNLVTLWTAYNRVAAANDGYTIK